jgi:hypothetical protein
MSGGSQNTVSQQTVPDWLKPFYVSGLDAAKSLSGVGMSDGKITGPQQSAGQIAPMTALQNQGISSIQQAAGQDPTASAAGWNQFVTSGGLMNPNSNPYLAGEFSNAANAVQNQLGSEFGAAGRNVLASAPVQADALNHLATDIYGGAYNTNLQATNQAAAQAPYIGSGLYTPGQELYNAGTSQQQQQQNVLNTATAQYNYNQALPYNSLSWYSSLLGQNASPFGGSSTTATMNNNRLTGGLGGAASGAAMGSEFGPWGTAGGALIGGLMGAFG